MKKLTKLTVTYLLNFKVKGRLVCPLKGLSEYVIGSMSDTVVLLNPRSVVFLETKIEA